MSSISWSDKWARRITGIDDIDESHPLQPKAGEETLPLPQAGNAEHIDDPPQPKAGE